MEKSQKKKIAWAVTKGLLTIAVFVGMFFISIAAGISALIFSAIGYAAGFCTRGFKSLDKFFNAVTEHMSDMKEGSTLQITVNDENESFDIKVVEPKQKKKKEA